VALLERPGGRQVTRRLVEPRALNRSGAEPGDHALRLAEAHNEAVRLFGSDSGGFHAYDPARKESVGVHDGDFPQGAVVTPLAWGRIDAELAQRILEGDGWA
jgi:hypothetical protein